MVNPCCLFNVFAMSLIETNVSVVFLDWLLDVKDNGEDLKLFGLQEFIGGRRNQDAFELTMERFAPCVVGKSLYKQRLKSAKCEEDLITVSDEAFLYLILENAYDRWVDIFKRSQREDADRRTKGREWRWESDVPTQYTEGGIKFSATATRPQGRGSSKGWTNEGILRYNELFRMVRKDRQNHKHAFQDWVEAKQVEMTTTKKEAADWRGKEEVDIESDLFERFQVVNHSKDQDKEDDSISGTSACFD